MNQMLDKLSIREVLSNLLLPKQGSNRGYSPEQLILQYLVGIWCGASCFEHLEVTRQDAVIRDMFGWESMAGSKAFQRHFNKFNQATNQEVFGQMYNWFFSNLKFDNYTLGFDSTIMTRHGQQEGAKKGYNPKKPGRNSHHPLMAFVSDCRMIANCWLRPGNSSASNNFFSFLEDSISKIGNKTVGLIRADSGFYSKEIFSYLESSNLDYVIAAKFYMPIKRKMARQTTWLALDHGLEIAETTYQADDWDMPRRLVMVRQEINQSPKATGKQLCLFEGDFTYKNYRYSCYVTNMSLPSKIVYDMYRGRADCENRIEEVKADFGAGNFNVKDF
jgi:hypothetical protein